MRLFYRKIVRDLLAMGGQCAAITAAVFLGVALFVSSWQSYKNLLTSYQSCYRMLKFADFWQSTGPAPRSLVSEVQSLPGVEAAVGRIVQEAPIEQPGTSVPRLIGRFISLPADHRPEVNDVQVTRGRYLTPSARREVLLEHSFAEHHGYRPGDVLRAVVGGASRNFRIVGLVISPEYLYAVPSKESTIPTPDLFAVVFVAEREAEDLFGLSGRVTDVCVRTQPGPGPERSRRSRSWVMAVTRSLFEPYGAEEPVTRERQPSNYVLSMDLKGFSQVALIFPTLFLTAAALTIYTVLSRLVRTQQRQIGYLRASGLDARSVGIHYLIMASIIGVAGVAAGVGCGLLLSVAVTRIYLNALHLPVLVPSSPWGAIAVGTSIGILACFIAALRPALYAAGLRPAEAMRGEAIFLGPSVGLLWLIRSLRRLRTPFRLPVRNLFRHRLRTLYTAAGIACGVVLIVVAQGMYDSSLAAVNLYFHQIRGYDIGVIFAQPRTQAAVSQMARIPGVVRAEGYVDMPVRLVGPGGSISTTIYALFPWTRTVHLVTQDGQPVVNLGRGLYIADAVRKTLGVGPGDLIRVAHARSSRRQPVETVFPVEDVVRSTLGGAAYMRADVLMAYFAPRLGLSPGSVDGTLLIVEPRYFRATIRRAYDLPGVTAVENAVDIRTAVDEMMALTYALTGVMSAFGLGLTLAIIYNAISMNLFERRAEIASMRAQGVTLREVTWMVTIENLMGSLIGVLPGIPLGRLLLAYILRAYETEMLNLPFSISPRTYCLAVSSVLALTLLCQIPGLRSIRRMDLAAMARAQSE